MQWAQDTKEVNRNLKVSVYLFGIFWPLHYLSFDLRFVYLFGIFWPLYCLSFDLRFLFTSLVSCAHCIIYQRGKQTLNQRTDNTIAKRYQRGKQTLNRRTDNAMAKRYQRGKQTLNQRISFGHCIVCPSI
jgi:hypothetical protein